MDNGLLEIVMHTLSHGRQHGRRIEIGEGSGGQMTSQNAETKP
jgi:hypothetical protein